MLGKEFTKHQLGNYLLDLWKLLLAHPYIILQYLMQVYMYVHLLYLLSCRIVVYKNGIRTTEFFRDHDKLRSGVITENQVRDSCGTKCCFITVYTFVVGDFSWWGRKETHNSAKLNKVWFLHVCITQVSNGPGYEAKVSPYPGVMWVGGGKGVHLQRGSRAFLLAILNLLFLLLFLLPFPMDRPSLSFLLPSTPSLFPSPPSLLAFLPSLPFLPPLPPSPPFLPSLPPLPSSPPFLPSLPSLLPPLPPLLPPLPPPLPPPSSLPFLLLSLPSSPLPLQFICGLSLCCGQLAHLSRDEIQRIVEHYHTPDGRVRYKEFCDLMENSKMMKIYMTIVGNPL